VYAYEPCEENYKLLIENIYNNSLSDKISAFRMAVSNKIGMREFYVDAYHYSGSSFYLKYFSNKKTFDRRFYAEMVKCTTLKQIFDDNNITHCNVLKIDCELEEKNILLDTEMSKILETIDTIIVEFHCLPYGKSIAEHLKNKGFSIHCNNQFLFEGGIIHAKR
jgi:FkbM family methyltransferase